MIVDDSFSRLTTRMIMSFSASCFAFGNPRLDSGQYFLKCFTVHAEHFVVLKRQCPSLAILAPIFAFRFRFPFGLFPCPSSLPPTFSSFTFRTFLQQIAYQKTRCHPLSSRIIHAYTSLSYRTRVSVHIFKRKELGAR